VEDPPLPLRHEQSALRLIRCLIQPGKRRCGVANAPTPAEVLVGALEDEQMHRRATAVRDFYRQARYTVVPDAEHELWHTNYLSAIKAALDRAGA